jgi:formylglycine-generating enzyme required for sulfatase activity
MKKLNLWLLHGIVVLLAASSPLSAQTPPSLNLRLFAGVNVTGTTGSVYVIQSTSDLAHSNSWTSIAFLQLTATNQLFLDTSAAVQGNRFYRAQLQTPPTNMVFIRPSTFQQGSPTNEVGHSADEAPQIIVTITHGFWMGRHEVTQREYLAVVGSNPSQFTAT